MSVSVNLCVCMYVCVCVDVFVCMCVYVCLYPCVYVCVCVCAALQFRPASIHTHSQLRSSPVLFSLV